MNIQDLLPKLRATTQKKKIVWKPMTDDIFAAKIGDKKFEIQQDFDEDTEQMVYRLSIYKGGNDTQFGGQFIDSIYADRFRGAFSDLEELYAEARRNALGIDQIISDIDNELDKLLP